jgi:lambda repressor-like predicted transcriptional regulator
METSWTWSERVTARIRRAISESGFTEQYVGIHAGVPNSTLSNCLNGFRAFNLKQVERIADVLGISPDEFIDSRSHEDIAS